MVMLYLLFATHKKYLQPFHIMRTVVGVAAKTSPVTSLLLLTRSSQRLTCKGEPYPMYLS